MYVLYFCKCLMLWLLFLFPNKPQSLLFKVDIFERLNVSFIRLLLLYWSYKEDMLPSAPCHEKMSRTLGKVVVDKTEAFGDAFWWRCDDGILKYWWIMDEYTRHIIIDWNEPFAVLSNNYPLHPQWCSHPKNVVFFVWHIIFEMSRRLRNVTYGACASSILFSSKWQGFLPNRVFRHTQ